MEVYALFTDGTSETVIIDKIAKKENEEGLILRTTITSQSLRTSALNSIKNAHVLLDKHCSTMPKDIAFCVYGFSNGVVGNSSDLAFALAFIVRLMDEKIIAKKSELPIKLAATGIIDERLNIRSVKGIKKKILAAIEAKAEVVFFPEEDLSILNDLKTNDNNFEEELKKIKTVPVKSLEDVFIYLGIIKGSVSDQVNSARPLLNKQIKTGLIMLMASSFVIAAFIILIHKINTDREQQNINIPTLNNSLYNKKAESTNPVNTTTNSPTPSPISTNAMLATVKIPTQTPFIPNHNISTKNSVQNNINRPVANTKVPTQVIATKSPSRNLNTHTFESSISNNTVGNTASNLNNYGLTSIQGSWIYYINNLESGIYKIRTDGTEKTLIKKCFASNINVIGKDLFYINKYDSCLYKIKTDGSGNRKLNTDDVKSIYAFGNWIYYINLKDNQIYKIDKNGFDKTSVHKEFFNNLSKENPGFICKDINVYNSNIYFSIQSDKNMSGIYKASFDGSMPSMISNEKAGLLTVDHGGVYYISDMDGYLYRMDLDGSNVKKISAGRINTFNLSSGWIYYSNSNGIYTIDSNGEMVTKIISDLASKINVTGEWIFYLNSNNGNRMYKVRINGKEKQLVD